MNVSLRVEDVRLGRRGLRDQVLLARVPVVSDGRASLCDLFLSNGDPSEGGSLVSEEGGDGSSVDSADSRDSVSVAPLVEGLDGEVVRVLEGDVRDDDSRALDASRLHLGDSGHGGEGLVGGDTVVSDERGGEDENLAEVGGIGHGLAVCEGRRKDEEGEGGEKSARIERDKGEMERLLSLPFES